MPKETFFRLEPDKKEKIEKALLNEFGRVAFEKASISNIIEEAKIPRGSFYQYFEDKEDAIQYIIEKFMLVEKQEMEKYLRENKGNIFKTSISIFDYVIDRMKNEQEMKLCKNILEELKKQNVSFLDIHRQKKEKEFLFNNLVDLTLLDIQEEDDLFYMMKILTSTTRNATIQVISKKMSKEEGRKQLIRQIEILKRGMQKNNG